MASPSYTVSSIETLFSPLSNFTPILCLQLLSTTCFHTVRDQAPGSTCLLSFVSDVAAFPSAPLLRDCGFDLLRSSVEGLTEQWPNAGCTWERLWDCASADAQRLWPGSSLSQKKFMR